MAHTTETKYRVVESDGRVVSHHPSAAAANRVADSRGGTVQFLADRADGRKWVDVHGDTGPMGR